MTEHKPERDQRRRWWRRRAKPVYTCEVCRGAGVERRGVWDYCPKGHTYVGERADVSTPPEQQAPR